MSKSSNRKYWVLFERVEIGGDGMKERAKVWAVEFGSWDKGEVTFEKQSRRDHYVKVADLKVVGVVGGRQVDIDKVRDELNAAEA